MNRINQYRYDNEIEMLLTFFVPQIKEARGKKQAEDKIFWLQYMMKYIVEKYYQEKE